MKVVTSLSTDRQDKNKSQKLTIITCYFLFGACFFSACVCGFVGLCVPLKNTDHFFSSFLSILVLTCWKEVGTALSSCYCVEREFWLDFCGLYTITLDTKYKNHTYNNNKLSSTSSILLHRYAIAIVDFCFPVFVVI